MPPNPWDGISLEGSLEWDVLRKGLHYETLFKIPEANVVAVAYLYRRNSVAYSFR